MLCSGGRACGWTGDQPARLDSIKSRGKVEVEIWWA
jgi:hypothetical protein